MTRILAALATAAAATLAHADATGLLYDPQPPANSAYVRVINAIPGTALDVAVDGKARVRGVKTATASDYMVLPAGKRSFDIGPAGKPGQVNVAFDVAAGRAMTVAIHSLTTEGKPWIFEDRANTNKLKSVVAVYYLADKGTPLDVTTADGATKVFAGVVAGTSNGRAVNPIKVDLVATASGSAAPLARASLAMEAGGTYSVLLLPGAGGTLSATALLNKVERYTGKAAN